MSWPKASVEKEMLLEELLSGIDCHRKRMFGAPVFFANQSMFAGVFADDIFLRLGEEDRARFLKENKGARTFEPVPGRLMREYVIAPHALLKAKESMRAWLELASNYARKIKE
jgi:TfoX/Sxy family transcriptional regulator of competence genes